MFGRKKTKRTVKKGEIRDLEVELISVLVDDMKPANRKGFVRKDENGVEYSEKGNSVKWKSDEQGYLYITVYEPGVKDSQGDSMTAAEIQKACESFSKKGMVRKNDVNHNLQPTDDVFIAENYILKSEDKEHYPDTKIGSWVQVLKCDLDGFVWKKVKAGKFNGVSLYGKCAPDDSPDLSAVKSELVAIKAIMEKQGNTEGVKEVEKRLEQLEKGVFDNNFAELVKNMKSLTKSIDEMTSRVVAKGLQGEPGEGEITDEEITINGEKITVKGEYKELYKSIGATNEPTTMNILNANEQSQFVDAVIEMPDDDTFSDISMIHMGKDEKIDKGLIEDIILKNKLDGVVNPQQVPEAEISCPSQVLFGSMKLDQETVEFYEEKYGEEAFGAYVNQKIIKSIRKQLKILLFSGDRTSPLAGVKALNGVVKQLSPVTVDSDLTWAERFESALLTFDEDMLDESENMVIYVNAKDLIRIRAEANVKVNNKQGRLIIDNKNVYFDDIPIKKRRIPEGCFIVGLPKFIIIGLRSDVKMIKEFTSTDWNWNWNVRLRAGITVVDGGFVKSFILKSEVPPVAENVTITGIAQVGEVLTGNYDYVETDGTAEGVSTFRWLSATKINGPYSAISGATSSTYTITEGDLGKYIKFEVTPVASSGTTTGVAVQSSPTVAVKAAS